MPKDSRVEWTEIREGELFYMIAELTPKGASCFERSAWEVAWYPARLTPGLVAMRRRYFARLYAGGGPVEARTELAKVSLKDGSNRPSNRSR